MPYIHENRDWPAFCWDEAGVVTKAANVRYRQGFLAGRLNQLGFELRDEAVLQTLTSDVVRSSAIEGVTLDAEQVRSSVARRLGIEIGALTHADRDVDGVVEMTVDATREYDSALTDERLFGWHAALFPTGRSGLAQIIVGAWRDDLNGPMQVVSGAYGRERVHYQAPDAERVPAEMARFLGWFNQEPDIDPVLKAAIAHLWFVTIHPFDDGNGRIARAIADMALARSEDSGQRFYSMSTQIRRERDEYYRQLESTQKGDLNITSWLDWFLDCLGRALDATDETLANVFRKARFWDLYRQSSFNPRQRDMLNRLLGHFEGKLTSSKWAKIEKCSPDTALRDINELIDRGVLQKNASGGRSTSYSLVENSN